MPSIHRTLLLALLIQPVIAYASPEADVTSVTVQGSGHLKKIKYLDLWKFHDRFRSPRAASLSVEHRLLMGLENGDSGFTLNYLDKMGNKAGIEVSKYGIVDLPDLDPDLAKTLVLTTRLSENRKGYSLSIVYVPRLESRHELHHQQYAQFLADTDAAFGAAPWSARMLFAGTMRAKANGMMFCFSSPSASILIGSTRMPLNPLGCYTHQVDPEFHEKKPTIFFDGDLVHVSMLQTR